jgi:hypothetical protein
VVGLYSTYESGEAEIFLEAAATVQEALPNVEFVLLGEGPHREPAEARAHQLGLSGASVFLPGERLVPELLGSLNVFTVLEDRGAAARHALQAWDLGVPVVALAQGALREFLRPTPLLHLLDGAAPETLASALREALEVVPDRAAAAGGASLSALSDFLVSSDYLDLDTTRGQRLTRGEENPQGSAEGPREVWSAGLARLRELYRQLEREREGGTRGWPGSSGTA